MKSLNQVTILGNLTRDVELRQTPSGQEVANFTVALNYSYKKDEEWIEQTDFVDVVAWGTLGVRASESLNKGSRVLVDGSLQSRSWEQTDGQKRSKLEVKASDVIALDAK